MARLGRGGFVALAVVFHLVYILSIFDIYFVSPIVQGMRAFRVEHHQAPAKRLVLFVGDGLRADKAFQSFPDPSPEDPNNPDLTPRPLAPFLRSRVLEHGTFGVSHTRVPTESRPGHVALIAGLYEDVSAVATGWKLNPVNFDSVFNRSRHTWSWGSPDILPMFKEGAVPGRVDAESYGEEAEDFTLDATHLDVWVFDKVKALFAEAKTNSTLNQMLREDKLVFFLHLLGLDTTGHSYRPYSKEYLHNIKVVDKGVAEIHQLIEDFYSDGKTAYVFTADHGMSDWGSHGDGHPDNTRTPLIAWGSGVAKPAKSTSGIAKGHEDQFSLDWNLDHIQRHDVAQADVAPLMAYLAGLEFPVNSVGEVPLSYLSAGQEEKARVALVNAQGVLEMYKVKEAKKKQTALQFRPFTLFAAENAVEDRIAEIETTIASGDFDGAVEQSRALIKDGLEGLRYLQIYDWLFLRTLITIGYLGWIAYALTTVIDIHVLQGNASSHRGISSSIFFSSILVLLYSSFIVDKSPLTYYIYAFFPVYFWEEVFAQRKSIFSGAKILFAHVHGFGAYLSFLVYFVAYVGVLQALVQSYFQRSIYTICYVLAAFWPFFYGTGFVQSNGFLVASWAVCCLILSTFTTLPVIKIESADTVSAGGLLMFLGGCAYLLFEDRITRKSRSGKGANASSTFSRALMGSQVGVILLTILVTRSSIASIQSKQGLPLGNQVVGWLSLIASLILPFMHRISPNNHYLHRLMVLFLAFAPAFVILTISYEGLFYFAFSCLLLSWVRLEHAVYLHTSSPATTTKNPSQSTTIVSKTATGADLAHQQTYRTLTLPDFRTSLFFLFLLQSAFFSTGNIASVASFSLDAVYRLIPIFDPFSQGALLLFKILTPFALISGALGILNRRVGLQSSALFMVVMSICDVMTLNFFWMVRDEGSWLDIGTTISHFVIGSSLSVFVAGLEGISEVLISGVEVDGFEAKSKREGGVEVVPSPASQTSSTKVEANGSVKGKSKSKSKHSNGFSKEKPVID